MDPVKAILDSDYADRTKTQKISFLKQLKANIDPEGKDYKFLHNVDKVSNYILDSTKNPSSRKTKMNTEAIMLSTRKNGYRMKRCWRYHTSLNLKLSLLMTNCF